MSGETRKGEQAGTVGGEEDDLGRGEVAGTKSSEQVTGA